DGEVKVLDFGVAAVAGGDDTDPGQRRGTPQYVAPERLDPTHPATPAGDLYSLGVLLYEVIVGRPPVSIVDWTQAAAVHRSGFTPPELGVPGLPGEVARLCRACLSPEPTQRPAAAVVARTLAGLAPGTQVLRYAMGSAPLPTQPVPAPVPTSPRPGRSRRLRQWGGLAAAGVVVVALGIPLGRERRTRRASRRRHPGRRRVGWSSRWGIRWPVRWGRSRRWTRWWSWGRSGA